MFGDIIKIMDTIPNIIKIIFLLLLLEYTQLTQATTLTKPANGSITLVPGQPITLQCNIVNNPKYSQQAGFLWWKKVRLNEDEEELIEPGYLDIEILNDKLTIPQPNYKHVGDYYCRALSEPMKSDPEEFGAFRIRFPSYSDDFGLDKTSHTGKSVVLTEGDHFEVGCHVSDPTIPVNISWFRSSVSEDDPNAILIPDTPESQWLRPTTTPAPPPGKVNVGPDPEEQIVDAMDQDIQVRNVAERTKRLVIESVKPINRGYYTCVVDNGIAEPTRRTVLIRVKDELIALWPALGILAELFILFTIIYVWETQKTYKEMQSLTKESSEEGRRLRGG